MSAVCLLLIASHGQPVASLYRSAGCRVFPAHCCGIAVQPKKHGMELSVLALLLTALHMVSQCVGAGWSWAESLPCCHKFAAVYDLPGCFDAHTLQARSPSWVALSQGQETTMPWVSAALLCETTPAMACYWSTCAVCSVLQPAVTNACTPWHLAVAAEYLVCSRATVHRPVPQACDATNTAKAAASFWHTHDMAGRQPGCTPGSVNLVLLKD